MMDPRTLLPLLLRRCSHVESDKRRCYSPLVASVVVSFPSGLRPDHMTFWCREHLDALDLPGVAEVLPTGTVTVRAS